MPLDLSLQSPSAFLEESPRALSSSIREGPTRHAKNRSLSPADRKKHLKHQQQHHPQSQDHREGERETNRTPGLNVGSWEWDNDFRHRTEKAEASDLNVKITQDSNNLKVLNMLSKQLQETTVYNGTQNEVGINGSDEARNILSNRCSVDDCLRLKQLRREERLKRRAADKDKTEDSSQPSLPVPRNDIFTREFHQEQDAKALKQKMLRKEQKLKERLLKEEKLAKAKKLAKSRLSVERLAKVENLSNSKSITRDSSPPKTTSSKVLPQIKPGVSGKFKLPEQVMSSKFPVSCKDMLLTVSKTNHSTTLSFLDAQSPHDDGEQRGEGSMLLLGKETQQSAVMFPHMTFNNQQFLTTTSQMKSKSMKSLAQTQPQQVTKPTAHATDYVDKQHMWALQVEAKNMKARKEREERELSELRVIPDIKKAQESWVKLKQNETKKFGHEWPLKKEADIDIKTKIDQDDTAAEQETKIRGDEEAGMEDGHDADSGGGMSDNNDTENSSSNTQPPMTSRDEYKNSTNIEDNCDYNEARDELSAREENITVYDTAVKDMTTADNIANMRPDNLNDIPTTNTIAIEKEGKRDMDREQEDEFIIEGVIEGEDGFEDDDEMDMAFMGGTHSTTFGSAILASSVLDSGTGAAAGLSHGQSQSKTAASEFGYDEQFFATNSVVKTGASLVLCDGAVIGGFAYEHPLQTNKNDSVYTTPASPLKKVVGEMDEDKFDTDRFEDTERSTYDTPKGLFGREAPPTSVRGGAYRWDSDEDEDERKTPRGANSARRREVERRHSTGRGGSDGLELPVDTARSDCSDYEGDWEFTGLPEYDYKTARGSEGTWKRRVLKD